MTRGPVAMGDTTNSDITRRDFLGGAASAALAAGMGGLVGCQPHLLAGEPSTKRRLNFVIIYVDDLDFDEVDRLYHNNKEGLPVPKALQVHNNAWVAQGACDFLRRPKTDQPFFLYMALTAPHGQYYADWLLEDERTTSAFSPPIHLNRLSKIWGPPLLTRFQKWNSGKKSS